MKVYVVMSNDYPDCVFAHKLDAEHYRDKKTNENKEMMNQSRFGTTHHIYYRVYEFDVK